MSTFLLTGKKPEIWTRDQVKKLSNKVGDSYDQYIIFKQFYKKLTDTKEKISAVQNDLEEPFSQLGEHPDERPDDHSEDEEDSVTRESETEKSGPEVSRIKRSGPAEESFQLVYRKKSIYKYKDDLNDWNAVKKLTNPFELIHIPSKGVNNSVAYYIPVSRSYFKMLEMLKQFEFFKGCEQRTLTIANLAEGPGGFIEAIVKNRKDYLDNIFGLTLRGNSRSVPNWRRMQYALAKLNKNYEIQPNVDLSYGDLYQEEEIRRFTYKVKSVAHLITADGGFDFTSSFNYQEQVSYRLIFSEILTSLHIQATGGHFVCKIFDIFSILSMKMIYLVYCFYEEVYIFKPQTSRPANSEKYLVAKNFRGIEPCWLQKLREIQDNWIKDGKSTLDIAGLTLPNDFIQSIFKFNQMFVNAQVDNIEQTLKFIYQPPSKSAYKKIITQQVQNGIEWCEKYNEGINYKSNFRNYYNS